MAGLIRYVQFQIRRFHDGLLYTGVVLVISLSPLSNAWALQASPTTLSFQVVQGGPNAPSQIVTISQNSNNTVIWSSNDTATWVSLTPTMGMMTSSTQVSVSVNPAGLATGTYTATVTIIPAKGQSTSLPVTLTVTSSGTANLSWNPDSSTNVVGYKVYMGTASGTYTSSTSVGNVTSYTVTNLGAGKTYYFAVTAYNSTGSESGFSNEVSKSIY